MCHVGLCSFGFETPPLPLPSNHTYKPLENGHMQAARYFAALRPRWWLHGWGLLGFRGFELALGASELI